MWSPADGNLSGLYSGASSLWFQVHSSSKFQSRDFQLSTMMGFSSCPYWYSILNSCRHLKSKTLLQNAQVNKSSSVNNGLAKTCLIMEIVRSNWLRIVYCWLWVALLLLDYFGSLWIVPKFSTAEKNSYHGV